MKILVLIFALFVLSSCANQTSALNSDNIAINNTSQPSPTVSNVNANSWTPLPEEAEKIDNGERGRLEKQNQLFRDVPNEFKKIDFQNFSYPYKFSYNQKTISVPLKKDEDYKYDIEGDRGWFEVYDVFFVDLTGDDKKEAIVLLWHVSCGVSCDGGSGLFYVYSIQQSKPNLLWQFETGSLAYGGGLKSFHTKNKKITIEEFDKCSAEEEKPNWGCDSKFAAKDIIRLTFGFNGKKFGQESKEIIPTPASSVMNYRAEISINQ